MPRTAAIDRPVKLTTTLRETIRARLDLHLISQAEGRVPKGAYQAFLEERIKEYFEWGSLEVAPGLVVRGPSAAITALQSLLKEHQNV